MTGNVLRDYLTDLFPIIELGTSAKMLSIVPLIPGGGLLRLVRAVRRPSMCSSSRKKAICAGTRSASSLAGASLEHWRRRWQRSGAGPGRNAGRGHRPVPRRHKSPPRKVDEIDNRGSHFYLALYWAEALAAQTKDKGIQARFAPLAKALKDNEAKINAELIAAQGKPVDMGGYYLPDFEKTSKAMRPSATFNAALDAI